MTISSFCQKSISSAMQRKQKNCKVDLCGVHLTRREHTVQRWKLNASPQQLWHTHSLANRQLANPECYAVPRRVLHHFRQKQEFPCDQDHVQLVGYQTGWALNIEHIFDLCICWLVVAILLLPVSALQSAQWPDPCLTGSNVVARVTNMIKPKAATMQTIICKTFWIPWEHYSQNNTDWEHLFVSLSSYQVFWCYKILQDGVWID